MKKKTILICLEKLGAGGVETSVFNQSLAFKEKGYNVIVLAENGIYTEKLQAKGIICIDFEFKVGNEIDREKTAEIVKIIKQYNVGQVHIHQFPCLLSAFPACIITNIPYIAFIHSRLTEVFDWYINNFSIYKTLFNFYFHNAYKIITLNYGSIELNTQYFNTKKEKYRVLKNSITFSEYVSNIEVNNINNFMIISRIAAEKIIPIQNGIKCFIEYAKTCENFNGKLGIYGDGTEENINKIKKYIEENNTNRYNIFFAGKTNEVAKEMEKYDVVIAMGRCIIEALATKRLAIVTSPNELKFLVNSSNIYDAIEGNFASNDLKSQSLENIIKELKGFDNQKIKKITEENYEIVLKELNMLTNVYCIEEQPDNKENYELKIIDLMDIQIEDIKKQKEDTLESRKRLLEDLEKYNNILEDLKNKNYWTENIIEEQKKIIENTEKRNQELFNELNSVYNSKRFKIVNKIANILHGKK